MVGPLHELWRVFRVPQRAPECLSQQPDPWVQRDGGLAEEVVVPTAKLLTSQRRRCEEMAWRAALGGLARRPARAGRRWRHGVVFCCGMVGLGAIAGAAAAGARVVAVDVAEAKLGVGRATGAVVTINSKTDDLHERLQALTENRGPESAHRGVGLPETYRALRRRSLFRGARSLRRLREGAGRIRGPKTFVMKEIDIMARATRLPTTSRRDLVP